MAFNFMTVDDSVIIRTMLKKTLSAAGIPVGRIHEAGNGREALEILRDNWVDLVFIDINMPVMNGVEMIDAMREEEILDNLPTVVVSTEGSQTKIEKLKNKGVTAFIRKPFTPELIRNIVKDILGEWEDEPAENGIDESFSGETF